MRSLGLAALVGLVCGALMAGSEAAAAAPWGSLRPTHDVLDIVRAEARGDARTGSAQIRITYDQRALGWTLPRQVLRIAFGSQMRDGCRSIMPMTLVVEMDFPRGAYRTFTGSSYAKPSGRASVKVQRGMSGSWIYVVKSPHLRQPGVSCVWVAVGDRDDWEWFVNAGAFEGKLRMKGAPPVGLTIATPSVTRRVVRDLGLPLKPSCYQVSVTHSSARWGDYSYRGGWPRCKHSDNSSISVLSKVDGKWRIVTLGHAREPGDEVSVWLDRLRDLKAPASVVRDFEACWLGGACK